jgi:putative ABC transport system permease protein
MVPLKYNVRNLRVRRVTTLLTVMVTGLVVWISCILFGMVDGLHYTLKISGDPLDLLILRKGSTTEGNGGFDLTKAEQIETLPGIARDESGMPLAAAELVNVPVVPRIDGTRTNIIVRGVDPASPKLRPQFQVVQGRYFIPGRGECVVSRNLSRRFRGAQLHGILQVGEKESYRVVGLFTAGGSAAESEAWVDRKDLERNTAFAGAVSSVQLRAASPTDLEALRKRITDDAQFKLLAWREGEYFANQSRSSLFLEVAGTLIAVLLTVGAMFAAANTMFAAVSTRTREIGTMRALGFSRFDVLLSFLGESLLLCALGGILGLLATLPLGSLTFGTQDFNTFSERTIRFRMGPFVVFGSIAMTLAMGLFGGVFPALRAVRLDVIKALREL